MWAVKHCIELDQQSNAYVKQSTVGQTHRTAKLPQEAASYLSSKEGVKLLDMSGILRRNILVNTTQDELSTCMLNVSAFCSNQSSKVARQQYEKLNTQCNEIDLQIDRSYRSFPGTAEEWHKFCTDCACLILMREALFQIPFKSTDMNHWDEEAVQRLEAHIHRVGTNVQKLGLINYMNINQYSTYNIKVPPNVLKWNNSMMIEGNTASVSFMKIVKKYEHDEAAAKAAYKQALEICQKLDNELTYLDSKRVEPAYEWKGFRDAYVKLVNLRQLLVIEYNHDPFGAACEETLDDARPPAARKHAKRLRLASPPRSRQMPPASFHEQPVSETVPSPQNISTTATGKGCICVKHDKVVWRQGPVSTGNQAYDMPGTTGTAAHFPWTHEDQTRLKKLSIFVPKQNAFLCINLNAELDSEAVKVARQATTKECHCIRADDLFTFHVSGIYHGHILPVDVGGFMVQEAFRSAQKLVSQDPSVAMSELDMLQQALQGYNIEQLQNLAAIGVPGVEMMLKKFEVDCVQYLFMQYMVHVKPIVIAEFPQQAPD